MPPHTEDTDEYLAEQRRKRILKQRNRLLQRHLIRRQTSGHSETNESYGGLSARLEHDFQKAREFQRETASIQPFEASYKSQSRKDKSPKEDYGKDKSIFNSSDQATVFLHEPIKVESDIRERESKVRDVIENKEKVVHDKALHSTLPTVIKVERSKERILKPPLPKPKPPIHDLNKRQNENNVIEKTMREEKDDIENEKPLRPKKRKKKTKVKKRTAKLANTLLHLAQTDTLNFINKPCKVEFGVVQCYIERNKVGGTKRLYPEYHLFLKEEDTFLLASKKRARNRTSNYVVSLDPKDMNRNSSACVGKLRANFLGTEFQLFDNGVNPTKKKSIKKYEDVNDDSTTSDEPFVRSELGAVLYASNIMGSRGPRKMRVAVPKVVEDGSRILYKSISKKESMLQRFKASEKGSLTELINKPPRWNDQVGAYVLNFNGRVTMASVKNFQLVLEEDEDKVVLQFGRVGKNLFTMDLAWPLSPLQAFGICLSSFDSKLACE